MRLKKANGICLIGIFEIPSLKARSQKHKERKEIKRAKDSMNPKILKLR